MFTIRPVGSKSTARFGWSFARGCGSAQLMEVETIRMQSTVGNYSTLPAEARDFHACSCEKHGLKLG